ncbi:MAG: formate/nitrite transporter family protein [Eubacteriales bacterium]
MLICEGISGILAALCVSLGGCVFLSCENRMAGAFLFSVALLTVCCFGFSLYTGRIGWILEKHSRRDLAALFCGLAGNLAGSALFGLLARAGLPALAEKAEALCVGKLAQTIPEALIRAFFCGVLMYTAVWIFKVRSSAIGILLCIPTFILSGFEHAIADAFYFAAAAERSLQSIFYLFLILSGNTAGGCLIPCLQKLTKERTENA